MNFNYIQFDFSQKNLNFFFTNFLKKILGKPIEYDNDKSIETSCLKYIIDNLYEGSDENGEKHVLYKQLILKFNSYKIRLSIFSDFQPEHVKMLIFNIL